MKASDFSRHTMGDNRRFHVRTYNGGKWQVYGCGLAHVCDCESDEAAQMIADALERQADSEDEEQRRRALIRATNAQSIFVFIPTQGRKP